MLQQLAALFLGMLAGSVPVKCLFSVTGLICNSRQSSICPSKLNKISFRHNNLDYVGQLSLAIMGGDLAPSLRGRKNFRGPNFPNDLYLETNFLFNADNFDTFLCLLPGLCCLTSDIIAYNYDPFS